MNEDEITAYLKQFTLEQLNAIQVTLDKKILEKKERERQALEERKALEQKQQAQSKRPTVGLPPTPPKDIAALAEAADLDISHLLRDIDRRKR